MAYSTVTMEEIKLSNLPKELNEAKTYALDGGNHYYRLEVLGKDGVEKGVAMYIDFIKGGRNTEDCQPGIVDAQLIEVLLHRTMMFEEQFQTGENVELIELLEKALQLMNNRTISRHERGVLGSDGSDYE